MHTRVVKGQLQQSQRWMRGVLGCIGCVLVLLGSANTLHAQGISPAKWASGDVERYLQMNAQWGSLPGEDRVPAPRSDVDATHGMVVGATGAFAVHAGVEVLRAGGSAADAAVATALTQITLAAGSYVSFAGLMSAIYYDASTGEISTMNASFAIPKGETDPLSIPTNAPSGRTAPVPGFLAGVQALHDKFGKLPFGQLFEPAIYLAEQGMPVDRHIANAFRLRREVLARLPETRATFLKADGTPYLEGEVFRQPALAATLRHVAQEGAAYTYRGPWAQAFVKAVQADGGVMTLDDLASYEVLWDKPISTTHNEYTVYSPPSPDYMSYRTLAALNLLAETNLPRLGHPATSPEALREFLNILDLPNTIGIGEDGSASPLATQYLGTVDASETGLLKHENTQRLWQMFDTPEWSQFQKALPPSTAPGSSHSDAIVVVDANGNVIALTHTINSAYWGSTGIAIGGISIPDAFSIQLPAIEAAIQHRGPGARLRAPLNPMMALQNGKPVLAGSSIGSGLYELTIQSVMNILDYGMSPQKAIDTGAYLEQMFMPKPSDGRAFYVGVGMKVGPSVAGPAADKVRDQALALNHGKPLDIRGSRNDPLAFWAAMTEPPGQWAGVTIDPKTRQLRGGVSRQLNGIAEGY